MILLSLALFCVGLCVDQRDWKTNESLPRPSISAWPSWVVPAHSKVTLRCSAPIRGVKFVFIKNNLPVQFLGSSDATEAGAELLLIDLQNSNAGAYNCEYYRRQHPSRRSPPSDVFLLLVTGDLPKPSLRAHQRGKVTAGENITLQCQKPRRVFESYTFALLKEGTSTPLQFHGETESAKRAGTLGTIKIILIVTFTSLFLLAALLLIYKYTCCGAARNRAMKRSCSSKNPKDVMTGMNQWQNLLSQMCLQL